jgi:hypothetical protein
MNVAFYPKEPLECRIHVFEKRALRGGVGDADPMLRHLLEAFGPSPLRLITARADIAVSGVVIYEPRAARPPVRHGMLSAAPRHRSCWATRWSREHLPSGAFQVRRCIT